MRRAGLCQLKPRAKKSGTGPFQPSSPWSGAALGFGGAEGARAGLEPVASTLAARGFGAAFVRGALAAAKGLSCSGQASAAPPWEDKRSIFKPVSFSIFSIEIKDVAHAFDVQPAGRNIRRHKQVDITRFESLQFPQARGLIHIPMDFTRFKAMAL